MEYVLILIKMFEKKKKNHKFFRLIIFLQV